MAMFQYNRDVHWLNTTAIRHANQLSREGPFRIPRLEWAQSSAHGKTMGKWRLPMIGIVLSR
jgi:hypothetical protein